MKTTENKRLTKYSALNIAGIVLCVLLLPILLFNCVLIVKGIVSPKEVPSIFGNYPMIVLTGSMEPDIKKGDLIFCQDIDPQDVKVGDVISFFDPSGKGTSVITHEVIETLVDEDGNLFFRTKGRNNNIEDRTLVPAENVVGIWHGARIWGLGSIILFTQSFWGILVCIVVPIGLFVAYYLLNKRKADKQKQSDIDSLRAELALLKQSQGEPQEVIVEEPQQESDEVPQDGADDDQK